MTSPKRHFRTLLALALVVGMSAFAPVAASASNDAPDTTPGQLTPPSDPIDRQAPASPDPIEPNTAFAPGATKKSSPGVSKASTKKKKAKTHKCFGRKATIIGTPHNDRIYGTDEQDVIIGLGGNDLITSGLKNDFICGDGGTDQAYGFEGNDSLSGGEGADQVFGGDGGDFLYGEPGDDQMDGEGGTDYLYGANGYDTLFGGVGDASNDFIFGGPQGDTIDGGDGNDNLYGQDGNDTMSGDAGSDRMTGAGGRDTFDGGADNDTMTGAQGDDQFFGGDGNDTAWGDGNLDYMEGGLGLDTLHGGENWDTINGNDGGDTIFGEGDTDTLCGGPDVDTLYGGEGDDLLSGEADNCTYAFPNLLDKFSTDEDVINLNDGGPGFDICVSPSSVLTPQTVNCESDGFLRLNVQLDGHGNVTSDGVVGFLNELPIDCNEPEGPTSVCKMFFLPADMPITLDLIATAANGWTFDGWTGAPPGQCTGLATTCTVTLTAADFINNTRTIQATFIRTSFTLGVTNSTGGTVTSSPTGITCPGTCSASFGSGTSVTLSSSVVPAAGWTVSGVTVSSGCGAGNTTCVVTMNASGSVTKNA